MLLFRYRENPCDNAFPDERIRLDIKKTPANGA
jgi:hypothetical protein